MTDNSYPQENAYIFLDDLKETFLARFNSYEIDSAISYSLNGKFKNIISDKMNEFNKNNEIKDNRLSQLRDGVTEFHKNVLQADDLISNRGEKINLIVKKAENMNTQSSAYYGSVIKLINYNKNNNLGKKG